MLLTYRSLREDSNDGHALIQPHDKPSVATNRRHGVSFMPSATKSCLLPFGAFSIKPETNNTSNHQQKSKTECASTEHEEWLHHLIDRMRRGHVALLRCLGLLPFRERQRTPREEQAAVEIRQTAWQSRPVFLTQSCPPAFAAPQREPSHKTLQHRCQEEALKDFSPNCARGYAVGIVLGSKYNRALFTLLGTEPERLRIHGHGFHDNKTTICMLQHLLFVRVRTLARPLKAGALT